MDWNGALDRPSTVQGSLLPYVCSLSPPELRSEEVKSY